ncbi:hypothetical protein I350_02596 [Cryptococcus amylolentus CBS 6273]|uniref:Uncharacterized protein n=1 Tax=Cryptococcus amylolentus CBS 6273 TaxID=1296118 RepID=A0A1E3K9S9_9TREE|nr:hypothetical protein I350_02596 [Cryptococcus amylolentus CBS 6273]
MSRRDDRRPNISRPFDPAVSAWANRLTALPPLLPTPPSRLLPTSKHLSGPMATTTLQALLTTRLIGGTQGSIDGTMEGDNAQANMTSRFSSDSSRPTTGNASQAPVTSRFSSDTDDRPSTGGQGSSGDQGMRNTWIGSSPDSATCRERDTELQRRQLRQQQRRGHQVGASEVSDASREVVIGLETTTTAPDSRRTSSEYSQ